MLLAIGTPEQQWRDAGVDVHLGRVTVQELHDFGTQVIDGVYAAVREDYDARDSVQKQQIAHLKEEVDRHERTIADLKRQLELAYAHRA